MDKSYEEIMRISRQNQRDRVRNLSEITFPIATSASEDSESTKDQSRQQESKGAEPKF